MTNLLRNASFGNGHHKVSLPFISGEWPDDWELDWYYKPSDPVLGTGSPWCLPEMIVIEYLKQFPEDSHRYDNTDNWILKCFWNGAVGLGWKQVLSLPAGHYRFNVPVKPDQWHDVGGSQLVRPSPRTSDDWYLASEVFASIGSVSTLDGDATGWLDARYVPIGEYTVLSVACNHAGGDLLVRFGARGRWPFRNNGWFFDGLSLERIDEPAPLPEPEPIPQPGTVDAVANSIEQLAVDYNSMAAAISEMNALGQQILVDIANAREMVQKLKSEMRR